jgi:hypothetical protein
VRAPPLLLPIAFRLPPLRARAVCPRRRGRGCDVYAGAFRRPWAGTTRPGRRRYQRLPGSPVGLPETLLGSLGSPCGARVRRLQIRSSASARHSHASGERIPPRLLPGSSVVGPGCPGGTELGQRISRRFGLQQGRFAGRRPLPRQVLDPNATSRAGDARIIGTASERGDKRCCTQYAHMVNPGRASASVIPEFAAGKYPEPSATMHVRSLCAPGFRMTGLMRCRGLTGARTGARCRRA